MSEPSRPQPDEYHPFYAIYVSKVGPGPLLETLAAGGQRTLALLSGIDESRAQLAPAPGKWTLAQLVGHLSDTERVFAYRALSAARGDNGPLPSMDQEGWAASRDVSGVTLAELAAEFGAVRQASLHLLGQLTAPDWDRRVQASGWDVTVRALAFIIAGHELHHRAILEANYLG